MTTEKQVVTATSKYIRISPSKVDLIIAKIRGKSYKEALQILKYLPQKAGSIVWQTLYSAVSLSLINISEPTRHTRNSLAVSCV